MATYLIARDHRTRNLRPVVVEVAPADPVGQEAVGTAGHPALGLRYIFLGGGHVVDNGAVDERCAGDDADGDSDGQHLDRNFLKVRKTGRQDAKLIFFFE